MNRPKLEVCATCALTVPFIARAISRLQEEHSTLEVVERECLDVCQPLGAVKLLDEAMTLGEHDIPELEEKVRRAIAARE